MRLNKEQEDMLSGKYGRGTQKAIEILVGLGEAQGAEELVKISYAHLMPPDRPFGKGGRWFKCKYLLTKKEGEKEGDVGSKTTWHIKEQWENILDLKHYIKML